MLKRLRFKFIAIIMAIVTVMLCVIFAVVLHSTETNLENESLRTMQSIAASPSADSLYSKPGEDGSSVRLPYFLLYIRRNGVTIIGGSNYYDLSDEDMLNDILHAVTASEGETGLLRQYSLRYYHTMTALGDGYVFADASSELATMDSLRKTCLFIAIAVFFVFLLLSFFLAKWAVQPVGKAWKQQRQFVSDASHELKTPLTVIMTNAELLQSPECDNIAQKQSAESILTMSRQMRGLVESLLDLARVENSRSKLDLVSLDLSKLVSDALLPFEPVFFEKGLPLTSDIAPNLTVRGNAAQLRQVVEILLDNAQKYAAVQGQTYVTLRQQSYSHVLLTVSNQGEPIAPDDLKNIFKRFYRADKARTMNRSYGLGLSIAQGVVALHHGRIWAESRGGYNSFFVELPQ